MISFTGGAHNASRTHRTGKRRSFSKTLDYLFYGDHPGAFQDLVDRALYSGARNLYDGDDPASLAAQMTATAQGSSRVQKPVYHFGVSLEPGERLSEEQWGHIVDRYLEKLGLDKRHQVVWVVHDDTDHQHVHIVANRVSFQDHRVWEPHHDRAIRFQLARQLEAELDLGKTAARAPRSTEYVPTFKSDSERTLLERLRRQLPWLDQAQDWTSLEEALARSGAFLIPGKRGSGLVMTNGKTSISASKVSRSYSALHLERRFGKSFRDHRLEEPFPPLAEVLTSNRPTFTPAELRRLTKPLADGGEAYDQVIGAALPLARGRFTTRAQATLEEALFDHARHLAAHDRHALLEAEVRQLLGRTYPHLSAEQAEAVFHATVRSDLALIVGRAGAGKTTLTSAAVEAYQAAGYLVQGVALTGKAARGLQEETGMPSRTLAALFESWNRGDTPASRTVLVVDEASLLSTPDLHDLLLQARRSEAKVVLLGDVAQLQAIGPGDAFRGLLERQEHAGVLTIRRQRHAFMRRASHCLAQGRVGTALDLYEARGFVHAYATDPDAALALADAYVASPSLENAIILAAENHQVSVLNETVRHLRLARGELDDLETPFQAGERVLFTRNDYELDVQNGSLGTVLERQEEGSLRIRLDDGPELTVQDRYPHLAYGYALTAHKAQGVTVQHAYVLAGRYDRHGATTALTRHRDSVDLFYSAGPKGSFRDFQDLGDRFARPGQNHLIADHAGEGSFKAPDVALQEWHLLHPTLEPLVPKPLEPPHRSTERDLPAHPLAQLDRETAAYRELDRLYHDAGLYRLPGAVAPERASDYAALQRSVLRTGDPKERQAQTKALRALLTPPPPAESPLDPDAAWSRLRELAATSHTSEHPGFRLAARLFFHTAHDGSRRDLVRRFLTHESAELATELLESLQPRSLEERLRDLEPAKALSELPRLAFELRRGLAEARYRHRVAADLGDLSALEGLRADIRRLSADQSAVEGQLSALELTLATDAHRQRQIPVERLQHAGERFARATLHEPLPDVSEAIRPALEGERSRLLEDLEQQLSTFPTLPADTHDASWSERYRLHLTEQSRRAQALPHLPEVWDARRLAGGERLPETLDRALKTLGQKVPEPLLDVAQAPRTLEQANARISRHAGELYTPDATALGAALSDYRAAQLALLQAGPVAAPQPSLLRSSSDPADDLIERTRRILPSLGSATSWQEIELKLAHSGLFLLDGRTDRSLLVATQQARVSTARVSPALDLDRLERRFQQSYSEHRQGFQRPYLEALTARQPTFTQRALDRLMVALGDAPERRGEVLRHAVRLPGSEPARYTTPAIQDLERRLFARADSLAQCATHQLSADEARSSVAPRFPHLEPHQQDALFKVAQRPLALVGAQDGSQKEDLVAALATAYEDRGYAVSGVALTHTGAKRLKSQGLEARTLAAQSSLWHREDAPDLRLRPHRALGAALRLVRDPSNALPMATRAAAGYAKRRAKSQAPSLLIVDEAHRLDRTALLDLLGAAERRHAKVVLLGEPAHPDAGPFRGLLERHPSLFLHDEAKTWSEEASRHLALGRSGAALDLYDAHGALRGLERSDALRATVQDFLRKPENASLLGATVADTKALNLEIRRQLAATGKLDAAQDFNPGEPVRVLGASRETSGKGRITQATHDKALVALDELGRTVEVSTADVRYDYAQTLRQASKETVDHVHLFVGQAAPDTGYLALSSHRGELHLTYDRDAFPSYAALRRALVGAPPALAADHAPRVEPSALDPLSDVELLRLNRGLDPSPGKPLSSEAIQPLVHQFAKLRSQQESLAQDSSPLGILKRLSAERALTRTADDLYFAVGAERLPGSIGFDRAASYANARRTTLDLSRRAPERQAAAQALDELLAHRPGLSGDPEAAWKILETTAKGPFSTEHPDFRRAAAQAFASDPDTSSPRYQALRRWMHQEHPERAQDLLRLLGAPSDGFAAADAAHTTDVHLVQRTFEARLAVRQEQRALDQLAPAQTDDDAVYRAARHRLEHNRQILHQALREEGQRFVDRFAEAVDTSSEEDLKPFLAQLDRDLKTLAEAKLLEPRTAKTSILPPEEAPLSTDLTQLHHRAESHLQRALEARRSALESFPTLPEPKASYEAWHASFARFDARVEDLARTLDRSAPISSVPLEGLLHRAVAGDRSRATLDELAERLELPLRRSEPTAAASPASLRSAHDRLRTAARDVLEERPGARLDFGRAVSDYRQAVRGLPVPEAVQRAVPPPRAFLRQAGNDHRKAALLWAQAAARKGIPASTARSVLGSAGSAALTIGGKVAGVVATLVFRQAVRLAKEAVR